MKSSWSDLSCAWRNVFFAELSWHSHTSFPLIPATSWNPKVFSTLYPALCNTAFAVILPKFSRGSLSWGVFLPQWDQFLHSSHKVCGSYPARRKLMISFPALVLVLLAKPSSHPKLGCLPTVGPASCVFLKVFLVIQPTGTLFNHLQWHDRALPSLGQSYQFFP